MTSSADRVSSSLHMGDTTDDDKPCGQDVQQLASIVERLLHSGDADIACVLLDPERKELSEFSSSGAPEIKMGSAQHSLLLLGNIILITRYLKTNVLVHTTQDSLGALFRKAFCSYLTSDLEEFFKVYRTIAESLQNRIMVENVDEDQCCVQVHVGCRQILASSSWEAESWGRGLPYLVELCDNSWLMTTLPNPKLSWDSNIQL